MARSSTATPAVSGLGDECSENLRVELPERSVQRVADAWHGGPVQVNGRPVRGLRCKQLGHSDAQTSKARGELCSLPGQLMDIPTKWR